jgi:hypothetical protein
MSRLPGESWESFAERRIRQAQAEGEFDRLPGFGRPIPDIDEPWDENSWVRRKLRNEQLSLLPPVLEARLDRERTLNAVGQLTSEASVRRELANLNQRIRKAHYASSAGPPDGVLPVDIEAEVQRWKEGRRRERN